MPNGHDKEWTRLCLAVEGFRAQYGRWPTHVRLLPGSLQTIRDEILTPESFATVIEKVELLPEEGAMGEIHGM